MRHKLDLYRDSVIQCILAEPVTEELVLGLKFLELFRSVYPPNVFVVLNSLLSYFMEQSPS